MCLKGKRILFGDFTECPNSTRLVEHTAPHMTPGLVTRMFPVKRSNVLPLGASLTSALYINNGGMYGPRSLPGAPMYELRRASLRPT